MSVYKTVCEYLRVSLYLDHLSEYVSFIFNLIKKLHQKPSRCGFS